MVGPEVDDGELLAYTAEKIEIVVTRKAAGNRTLRDFERDEAAQYGCPVFILDLTRRGHRVALNPDLEINRWDVLTVRGVRSHVEDPIKLLGYADRL